MNVIYDMPRSQQVFVSDTYVNALTNIRPSLIERLAIISVVFAIALPATKCKSFGEIKSTNIVNQLA